MNDKDIFEFFKDACEFEHKRKDAINSRLSLVFTAIIVIIGAVAYFINNTDFIPLNQIRIVFFILLIILFIFVGFAFYYLFRCLFWYKYRYIARPELINKYISEIKEYKKKSNEEIDVGKKIEKFLTDQYIKATTKNRANNNIKNAYFIRAVGAIFLAGIVFGLLVIPYYAMEAIESEQIICVNVKNLSEISRMSSLEQYENSEEPQQPPQPEPEPVEPSPPPYEDISEADVSESDVETKDLDE